MYHEMVKDGLEQFLRETNEPVKVVSVAVNGVLEIILPDHKDDEGNFIAHGGSVRVRRGDFLVGRVDGSLFGVAQDQYRAILSAAPAAIPVVNLEQKR